jgi:hypothetical protein
MAVLCAAFAFGGWQMLHDPHVQGFERLGMMSCIFVFGLVAPLALARLITAWPLLRATDAGIEYRGVPWPWTHRTVAWEDIAAIGVRTAPSLLLGPYVMVIWTTTTRSPDRFENWQLPRSAKGRLRMLTVRFARQIEQHDVRIIGLNAGRRSSATAARSDAAPSR